MQKFRIRNLQLLVATDVAARGLDVDDLTPKRILVIYDGVTFTLRAHLYIIYTYSTVSYTHLDVYTRQ